MAYYHARALASQANWPFLSLVKLCKEIRLARMRLTTLLTMLCATLLVGTVAIRAQTTASLKFTTPEGWVEEKTSSTMRVAQYKLPKVSGDTEDGSLVLYYFGQGQGGGTAANIERWVGQIQQPASSPAKPKTETLKINGLEVTTVDITGTYVAETAPGSGEFLNKPNFRLRAAVVETPRGSYYIKLVGPEKTIARWDESYASYLKSVRFE
jgi:hypothetical protein